MPVKKSTIVEPVADSDEHTSDESEQEPEPEPEPVKIVKKRAPRKAPVKVAEPLPKAPVKRRTKAQMAADTAAAALGPNSSLVVNDEAHNTLATNAQPDPVDDPADELSLADLQALIKAQSNISSEVVESTPVEPVAPVKKPRGRPRKTLVPTAANTLDAFGNSKEVVDSVKLLSKLVLESGQQYKAINERLDQLTKSEDQAMKKQMADDIAKTRMFFQNLHKK